ncbi:MAG: polyprenyl diphosphate synthase [Pseudomonadota bacterium]
MEVEAKVKVEVEAEASSPAHVAIIMDGNRRWARARGLPTMAGHQRGADNISEILTAAREAGVRCVTLFAFSAQNWKRGKAATDNLLCLAELKLATLRRECLSSSIRVEFVGRLDRLPHSLRARAQQMVTDTRCGDCCLRIAIDYSARWAIWQASRQLGGSASLDQFDHFIRGNTPPLDLLVRTGDEQRLSDFLLWECAHSELYFSPRMWPEFTAADFRAALQWYAGRQRRFGA